MNRYNKEFKQQAVQLILEHGKSVNQAAKELGISNRRV
jgi:transposase-like protein